MANSRHSYKFNLSRQVYKLERAILDRVWTRCMFNLNAFIMSFYKYYAAYSPVPKNYEVGVVGKYSTGNYFKSLEIICDGIVIPQTGLYKDRQKSLQNFLVKLYYDRKFPNIITVRNLAESPYGWSYYTRVETKGWKKTKAYEPLAKAYRAALKSNTRIAVSSPRTGGRFVSFRDDHDYEYVKPVGRQSRGWGKK